MAYIQISVDRHTSECIENFEKQIWQCPEVLECNVMAGNSADYLLKVIVPDMSAYQKFLFGKITRIEGVAGVQSSFVLNKVMEKTELPLDFISEAGN